MSQADVILGIDLGTTFSVVAYLDPQGRPTTLPNAEGDLTTPSVVFLDASGAIVGREAVKAAEFEPDRVTRHPKRDMGSAWFHQPVRGETLPPEVLQALILKKLRQDAETRLGTVKQAVITVPAYFNEPRRRATQDAGRMAGIEVVDILNEPTAAAIAHGVQQGYLSNDNVEHPPETVLVYDLGGGTFDVTLMRVEHNCFTVLATAGDVELGGIDWDNRLIDHVAEKFIEQHGVDPRTDPHTMQRLQDDTEELKRTLTSRQEATIAISFDGKRARIPINRGTFEDITADLLDRTSMTLRRLMKDAGVAFKDLTRLLTVGGSTRMPMVTEMLERETGLSPDKSLSPDEAVAHGAAIFAAIKLGKNPNLPSLTVKNVCSHDLGIIGIERATGMNRKHTMIARNTPLPAVAKHKFGTFRDNQKSANVSVVEGGDASGKGSTPVGKCVVRGLPEQLPKNTRIEVTFRYAENGRLEVSAAMPTIGKTANMAIERAGGMPEELFAGWAEAVEAGMPDGYSRPGGAAALPPPTVPPAFQPPPPPVAKATKPSESDENPFDLFDTPAGDPNDLPPTKAKKTAKTKPEPPPTEPTPEPVAEGAELIEPNEIEEFEEVEELEETEPVGALDPYEEDEEPEEADEEEVDLFPKQNKNKKADDEDEDNPFRF